MPPSPSPPPDLIDRNALARFRARAARAPVDFLHIEAAEQVSERLIEVNRTFTDAAIVGPRAKVWQSVFARTGALADARLAEDADVLDLAETSLDLVVHALCLHAANDPVGQLIQMRRALRPDGLMIAALFGGQSLAELRSVLAEVEVDLAGGLSPRITPMGDIRDLGALLQRADFALPVADSSRLTITYPDLRALVRDLRGMGESNALTQRRRDRLGRRFLNRAGQVYADAFPADQQGRIRATAEIVFLTGWKSAPTQPQPLRPGSASARLSDALGTPEIPLPDKASRDNGGN